MKKLVCLCLIGLVALSITACSNSVSLDDYNKVVTEKNELQKKYDDLDKAFLEIKDKYSSMVVNNDNNGRDLTNEELMFSAAAEIISDDAFCTVLNEDIVQITVPLADQAVSKMYNTLADNMFAVSMAFSSCNFKSCIITVVDSAGAVVFGVTIKNDDSISAFISNEYDGSIADLK